MKRIVLTLLTLSVLGQAQERLPSIAIIHTGWEKVQRNVFLYYGTGEHLDGNSSQILGTVRKMGDIWMYQVGFANAMIPAIDKQTAMFAIEKWTAAEVK